MKQTILTFIVLLLLSCAAYSQDEPATDGEDVVIPDAAVVEEGSYDETEYVPEVPHTTVNPRDLSGTQQYTSEKLTERKFNDSQWKKVTGDADYDQIQSKPKNKNQDKESDDEKKQRRKDRDDEFARQRDDDYDSSPSPSISAPWSSGILNIIFYILIAAIIGAIIYMIIRNASWKSNPKIQKPDEVNDATNVEDISTLDIDDLLKRSHAAGNYRLALRINFLGLLKSLNEIGYILWKKDKTNRDYLNELFAKQRFYAEVQNLTLAYEQVWYGDHTLPVESYEKIMEEFKSLDVKLNASKTQ